MQRKIQHDHVYSDICCRYSPIEGLEIDTLVRKYQFSVEGGLEWTALEKIYENGDKEPCKTYQSNIYGGPLKALDDEDPAVEQQNRQLDNCYCKRISHDPSHNKLGSSLVSGGRMGDGVETTLRKLASCLGESVSAGKPNPMLRTPITRQLACDETVLE